MALRLGSALNAKGISVKNCAELIGVTEKTLNNKMTGRTDFMYKEVMSLKAMLPEYDINFLLTEDNKFDPTAKRSEK